MQSEREKRLKDKGYAFSNQESPKANYVLMKRAGHLLYSAGFLPTDQGALVGKGKVPVDISVAQATEMAALCCANILRAAKAELGSLEAIRQTVKLNGFVNSATGFTAQHLVMNGASDLMVYVLGEAGKHARAALGVAELPLGACVEVEAVFEIKEAV